MKDFCIYHKLPDWGQTSLWQTGRRLKVSFQPPKIRILLPFLQLTERCGRGLRRRFFVEFRRVKRRCFIQLGYLINGFSVFADKSPPYRRQNVYLCG